MKVEIFDVKHGACVMITGTNGKRLMIDCGFRGGDKPWFPSAAFYGQRIEALVIQNLDEDHVDDLPYVWENLTIGAFYSNPTVTAAALASMKDQGMDEGVAKAHQLLRALGPGLSGPIADLGPEVRVWAHFNRFGDFVETNDLSVAVFAEYRGFRILFGGDLETAGWRQLLQNPYFRADVASVRALVGSHHGRENGKCEELFEICRPDVVVFSDDAKQYSTQETDSWYRQRVRGIVDLTRPAGGILEAQPMRHVLTTRRDGTLTINVNDAGGYLITPERENDPLQEFWAEILRTRNLMSA